MDDTIKTLRAKTPRRTFMDPTEFRRIRVDVLRCSQAALASQLLSPVSGEAIGDAIVSLWERGRRPIPLWAARHLRLLEEAARRHDASEEE